MSWMFLGRSISRSRLSSSRSVCTPRGVIGNLSPILKLLDRADCRGTVAQLGDGTHDRTSSGHGGVVGQAAGQRRATHREGIFDRARALGGVDDDLDLSIDDAIDAVRAPLA